MSKTLPTYTIETVTPDKAWEWLMTSTGNRAIRQDHIDMLGAQMKAGLWEPNNNAITFDVNGVLIDGHHRLGAVVFSECTVQMAVCRGVKESARETIDVGPSRTLSDHLRFRQVEYSNQRAAIINAAARIVVGSNVPIKTVGAYEEWLGFFEKGLMAYIDLGLVNVKFTRSAKVAGPLVVAYKADPNKMNEFFVALRDGANLKPNNPALKLREFLYQESAGKNIRATTFDGNVMKIFAAAKAWLENRSIAKVQPSETATDYFRDLYNRGNARKLAESARNSRNGARKLKGLLDFDPAKGGLPADVKKMSYAQLKKHLHGT